MSYGKNTNQGKFKPKNPNKYKGDANNIMFRSSWELKHMKRCDESPDIIEWSSEEIIIPYKTFDGVLHRYFIDFYMKVKQKDGSIKTFLVEIKPAQFAKPPKTPKKQTKRFITEVLDYSKNIAKWKAADEFCRKNNITFMVLTEEGPIDWKKHAQIQ